MDELPTDALSDLARPMAVTVGPAGDRVAYQALEYGASGDGPWRSVFTVPTDGSADPHRLSRVSSPGAMRWSPEGRKLGIVTARPRDNELDIETVPEDADTSAEKSDSEDPAPQVWVYDLERGGDPRQVTDFEEGVEGFDWGPNGDRVVVSARDPTAAEAERLQRRDEGGPIEIDRLQHRYDGVGWMDPVQTFLFVVDVETRDGRRLDRAHSGGILHEFQGLQPAWHPDRDLIAFTANQHEDADDSYVHDVHLVDPTTGAVDRLTDSEYMVGAPTWSPDGTHVAFPASDPTNWYIPTDVCVANPETGASKLVTEGLDRTLAWFMDLAWLDESSLLTAIGDEGWSRFVRLDAAGGHERVFDALSRTESLTDFDTGGGAVAFARQHPTAGIDCFGLDAPDLDATAEDDDPRTRLTDLNPGLVADYDFPEIERVSFEGADGDDVEAVTFLPPSFDPENPAGHNPLLLSIHGGPRRYDEPQFDFDTAYWTTRGYVVCKVNYHGSTSYGRAFSERLGGDWNGVEVTDLLAGTDELVDRGWVDPDRLFVTGFSYGGRATAYVLTETDRFAAGVAEHGSYDLRAAFGTDDCHRKWEQEFGLPWENPEAYESASSITDVDDIDTPLMLTAGEEDSRCRASQAEQFYVSLRKAGVESKLVVYQNTNHVHYYVAQPDRAIHRLETMEAWFERFDPAVASDSG
mgnify:CR=1 FL=1